MDEKNIQPIRSTTQMWIVTRHQYGISALVPQTSFVVETSCGVSYVGCFLAHSFNYLAFFF